MTEQNWTRRHLIQTSMLGTAGMAFSSLPRSARGALGANERIRVAVAGVNGRGGSHLKAFPGRQDVEVACIVDPDSRLFTSRIKMVEERAGKAPAAVQDIRRVLDDKSIDAVSIATPNYWHSLMTIWACQAGKDVYVEKPMSHNVHEGRVAVQAARKYKRIVQHGTQRRSEPKWRKTIAAIHSGKLGKLQLVRGLCYKDGGRGSIGFKPPKFPPPELAWDVWVGPAPMQSYHENLVHYKWHWFWHFGNGDIGNQGVHQMDVARWAIPGATLPKPVVSLGGRLGYEDQGEVASTQLAFYDFGEVPMIFEVRGLPSAKYHGLGVGNIFHLEAGTIVETDFYPKDSDKKAPLPDVEVKSGPGGDNFGNFIAAMRSRDISDLNADVLEAHYSSALCHLANVSYRLGEQVAAKPRPTAVDTPEAVDAIERMEQYLGENGMKLEETMYQLGRKIAIDASTETIVNDAKANEMLTRQYRQPYVVPESLS